MLACVYPQVVRSGSYCDELSGEGQGFAIPIIPPTLRMIEEKKVRGFMTLGARFPCKCLFFVEGKSDRRARLKAGQTVMAREIPNSMRCGSWVRINLRTP